MKITRHTPDRLTLAATPWRPAARIASAGLAATLALGLAGLPDAALGAAALAATAALAVTFLGHVQVDLDARAGAVTLWSRQGLRRAARHCALEDLSCAVTEPKGDRHATTLVVTRGLGAGRYALTEHAAPLADLVDTVNLWLYTARRL
ncbi:MAG: hypothetical protein KDK24_18800 [Pseudooceanicola sp.]|nr:hypothetical protein [Pseudooceanicola sp.]